MLLHGSGIPLVGLAQASRPALRDSSSSGEPHVNGVEFLDGMIFAHGDRHWLARREDFRRHGSAYLNAGSSPWRA